MRGRHRGEHDGDTPRSLFWENQAMAAPDTVTDAVRHLAAGGYTANFALRDGWLRYDDQAPACPLTDAVVERMYRFEGDSDPGDEMVVFGIYDPIGDRRGTLVSAFGLAADPAALDQLLYQAADIDNE